MESVMPSARAKEPYREPQQSQLHKGLENIKEKIDQILGKIKKTKNFCPSKKS